jgi:acetyl-CoA carboxylase biotin carboxylase subunit
MRAVATATELKSAVRTARSESAAAFGYAAVYFEKAILAPRHIEIQLLGDHHGQIVPFVERECSIQRRHQKVVEESPSVAITPALRHEIAGCAARIAARARYTNAGTIEFLLDGSGAAPRWYFLEMNTRLQVEHPITEMVTGIDLVKWQLRIALGERLSMSAGDALTARAHAIECRVYAEDSDAGFLPSPGRIRALNVPFGPGVRDDSGVRPGFEIPRFYDSMMSKLIVWADSRPEAIARLRRALAEYRVIGVKTTLPFFRWLVDQPEFVSGAFDTTYLDRLLAARKGVPFSAPADEDERDAAVVAAIAEWRRRSDAAGSGQTDAALWRRAARTENLR